MSSYPSNVLKFLEENKSTGAANRSGALITLLFVLPITLVTALFKSALVLCVYIPITLLTFGKVNLISWSSKRSAQKEEADLKNACFDPMVYTVEGRLYNISKLLPIFEAIKSERYVDLLDGESVQFGIAKDKKRALIFTDKRIFYKLEAPGLSSQPTDGIIDLVDVKEICCKRLMTGSLLFSVNGEKIGVIPDMDDIVSVSNVTKLCKVISANLNIYN